MKCFVVIAALVATVCAEADPYFYASGAPLLSGYSASPYAGAIKTITPLRAPIARTYAAAPIARTYAATYAAPAPVVAAPVPVARAFAAPVPAPIPVAKAVAPALPYTSRIVAAPAGVVSSQYHKQDELKNYEFGYSNPLSMRHEAGNALTGVQGSFSYTDGFGLKHQRNYVADGLGFRVVGSDVPVATGRLHKRSVHVASPLNHHALPLSYGYHGLAAPALSYANTYAAPALSYANTYAAPALSYAPATYATPALSYAPATYAAPAPVAVTQSIPAAREAILTKIQLNPGHATAYRVFEDQGAY